MTKKNNNFILTLFLAVVFLGIIGKLLYLLFLTSNQYKFSKITFINKAQTFFEKGDLQDLGKLTSHLKKNSPLPFFLITEGKKTKLKEFQITYDNWNNQLGVWKDYGIFIGFSFPDGKLYFIPGKKLILRLDMEKISAYIERDFQKNLHQKGFPQALNEFINFIYQILKPNFSYFKKELEKLKSHSRGWVEKILLKWYFLVAFLLLIVLFVWKIHSLSSKKVKISTKDKLKLSKKMKKLIRESYIKKNWK